MKNPDVVCRRPLPPLQLREADISPSVLEIARGLPGVRRVVRELGLAAHTSRIDVAAVCQDQLIGFEIKSDSDKLGARWNRQCRAWEPLFDQLWIVVTDKHLNAVVKETTNLSRIVPIKWGVLVARVDGDEIIILKYRDPIVLTNHDTRRLMSCLWKEEAVKLVRRELGWTSSRTRQAKGTWYADAADHLDVPVLRRAVIDAFLSREHLHKRDGSL